MEKPEGVAAPLEPIALEYAKQLVYSVHGWQTRSPEFMMAKSEKWAEKFEQFAAAVSKNLQQERDKLKAELDLVDEALARRPALAHIEHRYNKIFAACAGAAKSERLEKEITALRETK